MKDINLILKVVTAILVAASVYLYIQNINSQSRISQLEKIVKFQPSMERDSLVRLLEVKSIQESQYLTSLNILSDWIIFYVTILFALVVVIEVVNFKSHLNSIASKYEDKQKENDEHFIAFYDEFVKLNLDFKRSMGDIYSFGSMQFENSDELISVSFKIYAAAFHLNSFPEKKYKNSRELIMLPLRQALEMVKDVNKKFRSKSHSIAYFEKETIEKLNGLLDGLTKDIEDEEDKKIVRNLSHQINEVFAKQEESKNSGLNK